MSILLVNVNIGNPLLLGGIESHSELLAAVLTDRHHHVIIGCSAEGSVRLSNRKTLPARRITIRNSGDLRAVIRILKISRRDGIEAIIANSGHAYWPAAVAAKVLGLKIIFVRHQTDRIRKTTRWLINHHIDSVIAVSEAVKNELLNHGVDEKKICVIHNAVPLERFDPSTVDREAARKELGVTADDVLVGTVAKLHRGKGIYELMRAVDMLAKEAPSVKLVYVGDGPERGGLEQEADRLAIRERVIFTGGRRDVERMYAAMDIFVLPSTCSEAFGMVITEAMAMGKPVIGTRTGGIPELISDGKSGILVPPGDEKALYEAIRRYLKDEDFRLHAAECGRRKVESDFSDKMLGDRFEKVLNALGVE
jgi:glycosyltransferase involved in cell wall biosynthesis